MTRLSGRIPAGLCIAGAFAVFCLPISNPDIYWHLSAGRWMAQHLGWPRVDWLSHTLTGTPWNDFEWLPQCIWYGTERLLGFGGLWGLKVAAYSAGGAILWRIIGLYGYGPLGRSAAVFFWSLAISPANDLRPENYSVLGFLGLWLFLEQRRLARAKKPLRTRSIGVIAVVFAFWANVHAGFVYGLALMAVFAMSDWISRRDHSLGAAAAAAAAAATINPYGLAVYTVLWEHWSDLPILERNIREWEGASILSLWLVPFWSVLVAAFSSVLVRYWKRRDIPLAHVAVLSFLGFSAAAHVRTVVYFVSAAIPIGACAWAGASVAMKSRGRLLFGAALAAAWLFFAVHVLPPLTRGEILRTRYVPVGVSDFLDRESSALGGKKLLHPWHWGGYLGYGLYPEYQVFVDGRYIFHSFLEDARKARQNPKQYAHFLDRYGIEVAILRRTGQRLRVPIPGGSRRARVIERPSYLFYLPKKNWALVYWDAKGIVFVKRSAVSASWIKAKEYRYFRPDDLEAAALLVAEGYAQVDAVAAEVRRHPAGDRAHVRAWLEALRDKR